MRTGPAAPRRAASRCTAEREYARLRHRHTGGSARRARPSVDDSCSRIGWSFLIVPSCTGFLVRFRFPPSLAHLGPEARARHAPTAVLLIPYSLRGDEGQQFAHPTDRLTQTFQHSLSHALVHEATRRCRDQRHSSETPPLSLRVSRRGTLSPSGVRAEHT